MLVFKNIYHFLQKHLTKHFYGHFICSTWIEELPTRSLWPRWHELKMAPWLFSILNHEAPLEKFGVYNT